MNRPSLIDPENKLIGIDTASYVYPDFLQRVWQNHPSAVVFFIESKPAAVMIHQIDKICNGWSLPQTTVPMRPEIYSNLFYVGCGKIASLVRIVNESDTCLSFEFEHVEGKLFLFPYRYQIGIDPNKIVMFNGNYEEILWLKYLRFLKDNNIVPNEEEDCIMSFEQYSEYLKTPEDHLRDAMGFSL